MGWFQKDRPGPFIFYLKITKPIKWADRLRVASDAAYGLSYMHNALSKPMVHRDIQSLNILLDDTFHAKLSNLCYSVCITPGKTSERWPVQGTSGYIDPEYIETQIVTEKCDVYSFGVLLEGIPIRWPTMGWTWLADD